MKFDQDCFQAGQKSPRYEACEGPQAEAYLPEYVDAKRAEHNEVGGPLWPPC
jgi:hypothetical protein